MQKEDAMLNGQLKPGYNIQVETENRYIVGFTIHPNPTDTKTMIPHRQHLTISTSREGEGKNRVGIAVNRS